jgi:small-conductance mechanosensitive channel
MQGKVRANISIGVAYGTDIAKAMDVIQKACAGSDLVLADPAPDVAFGGFGASSVDLFARPWSLPDRSGPGPKKMDVGEGFIHSLLRIPGGSNERHAE